MTPAAKFWICKRGSLFAQEAMECLGGNGYVEEGGEGVMARIYREMPLNSIWEGAGNIMALDLMRAVRRADAAAALDAELAPARGAHPALDRLAGALPLRVDAMTTEAEARRLAQDVALAVQAALLLRARSPMAEAFVRSRLEGEHGLAFGTLPAGLELENQNLANSAASLTENGSEIQNLINQMQQEDIQHIEFRDDRFVAALSVNEGQHATLVYLARAVTPGRYRVPPPQVESMYRPQWQAVGETADWLVVKGR